MIYIIKFAYNIKNFIYICICVEMMEMAKGSFSVDYVCMTPDKQIGSHSQLSAVITGSGKRTIGDATDSIKEGEVMLIPPGISHHWQFDSGQTDENGCVKHISVAFPTSVLTSLNDTFPEISGEIGRLMSLENAVAYSGRTKENIMDILQQMTDATPAMRVPLLMKMLLLISAVDDSLIVYKNNALSAVERKMERLRIYCKCNFDKEVSLAAVANHMSMNKSSFCKFVKRQTGKTFTHYLNTVRLEHSDHLLKNTNLPVSEIAYQCGFSCIAYFNKLFKAEFGVSPSVYRHRN